MLTVPALFDDEGARRTDVLQAARDAGLPSYGLEEPQAAFYDWLFRHKHTLNARAGPKPAGADLRRWRRHH